MKRRDGVCIETEAAFPQAGSVKNCTNNTAVSLQGERNVREFEMIIFKLLLCVRIFMLPRQCFGFETTLGATKVEETSVYKTRGLGRKDRNFPSHELSLIDQS